MKKIKGELTIKAFTDGRNTKVVVTGPKDIRARQLGNVSLTGTARCHEGDHEDSWIGLCIALGRALRVSKENIGKLVNALCEKKSLVGAVCKNLGMITSEQICPNGNVIYHGLRFKPVREVIGRGCVSENWGFDVDADEIKDEDITWRKYKIVERKKWDPPFSRCAIYSIVEVIKAEVRGIGFIQGNTTKLQDGELWVRLFDSETSVKVRYQDIKYLDIAGDYKVVIA